jgi:Putative DNA-binding domain
VDTHEEHIRSLVDRPHESAAVELKAWFDPSDALGVARVIRTIFALRNQDGGYLVIGIDDATRDHLPAPPDFAVRELFHPDAIQHLVSKYASQSFEVVVDFPRVGAHEHPVISIPGGVITPVACRADLRLEEQFLLREGDIFVRTLAANGTISSARMSWRDLEALTARCFENRDVNQAGILKKILPGLLPELRKALGSLGAAPVGGQEKASAQKKILEYGLSRFDQIAKERAIGLQTLGFWDVALHIDGRSPAHASNQEFLAALRIANPDLTGWPVWVDSSDFTDMAARPYPLDGRWEAFIYSPRTKGFGHWGELDFMILDPAGDFFLRRALQDDLGGTHDSTIGRTLDPLIAILRTAEAIAVGQAFARALNYDEETTLEFFFQWTGLKGREMTAWSDPMRRFHVPQQAKQDQVDSSATLAIGATKEQVINATYAAILPLSRVFGGYEIKEVVVRELVTRLLDRKL